MNEKSEGLITRIGRWLDRKWEAAATWSDVQEQESRCSERHIGLLSAMAATTEELKKKQIQDAEEAIRMLEDIKIVVKAPESYEKEVADLKMRIERIEIYSGMKRTVDPTKPAVAKSAFSM